MRIWRKDGFFNTLSGRFFLLTVAFVLLAEVMIFVPSMARFRADFLLTKNEKYGTLEPFRTYGGKNYLGGYSDHLPVFVDVILKEE